MTAAQELKAAKLRSQITAAEEKLQTLRDRLAAITPSPEAAEDTTNKRTWLDDLWDITPTVGRNRTTKAQCRAAWAKIRPKERPSTETLLKTMEAWKQSDEWIKDRGAYIPALHRWIKNRAWECPPEIRLAPSRARSVAPSIPTPSGPAVTDPAEIARLLSINPKCMRS